MKSLIAYTFLFFFSVSSLFAQVEDEQPDSTQQEEEEEINLEDIDYDEEADTIDIEDIDVDDIKEDELAKGSDFPWNKFAVGGQIGNFQFGDQTAVSLAPEVVYLFNDKVSFGADFVYELFKARRLWTNFGPVDVDYKEENLGGRFFTRIKPIASLPVFAQLEYERMNQEKVYTRYRDPQTGELLFPSVEQSLNNFNAGLGFNTGGYYIALLYNFMNNKNKDEFRELAAEDFTNLTDNPIDESMVDDRNYDNAIGLRMGINIPLGQGDRNRRRGLENDSYLPTF